MYFASWMTLSDVCVLITDGSHTSPQGSDDGYPMPSVKDMETEGFIFDKCKKN